MQAQDDAWEASESEARDELADGLLDDELALEAEEQHDERGDSWGDALEDEDDDEDDWDDADDDEDDWDDEDDDEDDWDDEDDDEDDEGLYDTSDVAHEYADDGGLGDDVDDDGAAQRLPTTKAVPDIKPFPSQSIKPLPGQTIKPLPGQTIKPLPGQTIKPLPGQSIKPIGAQDAQFRRFKRGVGACKGFRLRLVKEAMVWAHVMVHDARQEIDQIFRAPREQQIFMWERPDLVEDEQDWKTLGYWFSHAVTKDPQWFEQTLAFMREILFRWEQAFREGFYGPGGLPVFIRCKKEDCAENAWARHILRNTIEFCAPFFKHKNDPGHNRSRAVTFMHEMGHWLGGSATQLRDERSSLCSAGWNVSESICYREKEDLGLFRRYENGGPWELARAVDRGQQPGENAFKMLNNVDNYVCWMWNRTQ